MHIPGLQLSLSECGTRDQHVPSPPALGEDIPALLAMQRILPLLSRVLGLEVRA